MPSYWPYSVSDALTVTLWTLCGIVNRCVNVPLPSDFIRVILPLQEMMRYFLFETLTLKSYVESACNATSGEMISTSFAEDFSGTGY